MYDSFQSVISFSNKLHYTLLSNVGHFTRMKKMVVFENSKHSNLAKARSNALKSRNHFEVLQTKGLV